MEEQTAPPVDSPEETTARLGSQGPYPYPKSLLHPEFGASQRFELCPESMTDLIYSPEQGTGPFQMRYSSAYLGGAGPLGALGLSLFGALAELVGRELPPCLLGPAGVGGF